MNDPIRLDAGALRCKIVGEGANLGFTQRGRIAYSLAGGRINADFIDNSAGVSTSDHEVNIKILLGEVIADGKLSLASRDKLLAEMTDELAAHVLMDNYRQSMALTHCQSEGPRLLSEATRLIRGLERAGHLDRAVEYLPDDETILERQTAGVGLTRPELAVLLCYSKMTLYDEILASDIPDDPFLVQDVGLYFPGPIRKKYADFVPGHRLRRELSATYVTNSLVNRAGPTFISEVSDKTGASAIEVTKAYLISRQIFGLHRLWAEIEALDNKIDADIQTRLNMDILRLIKRSTIWMLRNGPRPLDITRAVNRFDAGIEALSRGLEDRIPDDLRAAVRNAAKPGIEAGLPRELAMEIASLEALYSGCDIVRIASEGGHAIDDVARIYYEIGHRLGLDWLRQAAEDLAAENDWQVMATSAIVDDLYVQQSELSMRIVDAFGGGFGADAAIEAWCAANHQRIARAEAVVTDLRAAGTVDLAMLTVASREIRALTVR